MTIADQINRLNNAKANIKQAIENKGVEVSDSALLDEYPALISSIPMEGGDPYYEDLYNLRTSNGTNMNGMFARTSGELDLRRLDVSNVTDMKYMFDNSTASVNIDGWDTSNVTDMSYMFYNFTGSIDISKLDTSKVTNVSYMLYYANTDKIILTGLSFPKCTSLERIFYYASGTTLDLSSWDISNITSMYYMFAGNFKKIDLTGWNTSNVTNMNSMFYKSSNPLEELIIPDWDMSNVTSSSSFMKDSYMTNLKLIDLSRSNDATIIKIASYLPKRTATTFGKVIVPYDTSQATYDALIAKYWVPIGAALSPTPTDMVITLESNSVTIGDSTTLSISSCEPWYADPNKIEYVSSDESIAVINDKKIVSIRTGTVDITARIRDTQEIIGNPVTLTITGAKIISELDEIMPNSKTKLYIITMDDNEWNEDRPDIELIVSDDSIATITEDNEVISTGVLGDIVIEARIIDTQEVVGTKIISVSETDSYPNLVKFRAASTPASYDTPITVNGSGKELSDLTYDSITDIYSYDAGVSITSIKFTSYSYISELIKLNTSNITNMNQLFSNCSNLTSLDLSNFNTSNVTNMHSMFSNCSNLTSLDLSNFDTSNVTNMDRMFSGCSSLTKLDVSNWDTSNVTSIQSMFYNCSALTSLDLSNWDISNVTTISNMFDGCSSLQVLDLSNWNATHFTSRSDMFKNCTSLHTLRLDNCNNKLIDLLINVSSFPTNAIDGVTRTIYCKEENAAGLTPPTNWEFSFVSIPDENLDYINSENPYIQARFDTQYQGHMNGESGYQWKYSFDGISWRDNDDCSYNEEEDIYNGATTEGNETIYFRPNNEQFGEDIGMYRLFENANGLLEAEFHNMDNVRNFENIIVPISSYIDHMFENTRITNVDLSWMNIEEIRNVDYMFSGCSLLETVDIRNLNIVNEGYEGDSESEITDMFAGCDNLREIRLDDCSNDTISMIVNSQGFPTGAIDDITRTIYCKESEVAGLTPPTNWVFSYVD